MYAHGGEGSLVTLILYLFDQRRLTPVVLLGLAPCTPAPPERDSISRRRSLDHRGSIGEAEHIPSHKDAFHGRGT